MSNSTQNVASNKRTSEPSTLGSLAARSQAQQPVNTATTATNNTTARAPSTTPTGPTTAPTAERSQPVATAVKNATGPSTSAATTIGGTPADPTADDTVNSRDHVLSNGLHSGTVNHSRSLPVAAVNATSGTNAATSSKRKPYRAYIDGCYDLMHSGHYNAIRQAKSLCDTLVIGVHSDVEIAHHKGPTVLNNEERLVCVDSCKWADEVVFGTPYDPSVKLLEEHNCDTCVHGDDISTTATGEDAFAAVREAGKLTIVKRTEGVSTTDLVGRLLTIGRESDRIEMRRERDAAEEAQYQNHIRSTGMSNFLPTTFRFRQFSNGRAPSPNDTVVIVIGDFDLFHKGHIELLKAARDLGTFLYVGLYTDDTMKSMYGPHHPIMSLSERVLCVLANKYVDECVMGVPRGINKDMIKSLNISIVIDADRTGVNGFPLLPINSSTTTTDPYADAVEFGMYRVLNIIPSLTTRAIVKRVIDQHDKYEKRNAKRVTKENSYLTGKEYVQER